jgi:putative SOS response-associated peptidase YedK
MCYYFFSDGQWLQELSTDELYAPWVQQLDAFEGQHYVNGFDHPQVYILTNDPDKPIAKMGWGLLPHWANKNFIRKSTLNAMVETLDEKPSYRSNVRNHCLIPAACFVDWQWLDPKGKVKQKWKIWEKGEDWFTFAGIYSTWTNPDTGEIVPTFTMITREAEGIMREIHNSKLRMPMIVPRSERDLWLAGELEIATHPELEAEKVE